MNTLTAEYEAIINRVYVCPFFNDNTGPAYEAAIDKAESYGGGVIFFGENDGDGYGEYWVLPTWDAEGIAMIEAAGYERADLD
jgi:hypothetical protein